MRIEILKKLGKYCEFFNLISRNSEKLPKNFENVRLNYRPSSLNSCIFTISHVALKKNMRNCK